MISAAQSAAMVDVVQLVEHQVVILGVAGSSPVIHPDRPPSARYAGRGFFLFLPRQNCDPELLLHLLNDGFDDDEDGPQQTDNPEDGKEDNF